MSDGRQEAMRDELSNVDWFPLHPVSTSPGVIYAA